MGKMEWISVEKDLPEEMVHESKGLGVSNHVLCSSEQGIFVAYYYYGEQDKDNWSRWVLAHGNTLTYMRVSHWMPRPEKPKKEL